VTSPTSAQRLTGRAGLAGGILAFVIMLALAPPAGMKVEAWRTAAVATMMAIWWITEALPIAATAFVPLIVFPLLGIASITAAAAPYANPVIFLFLGGFLLAAAFQRCGLHRRVALAIIAAVGTRPDLVGQ
jgi:sodium-dependent dicarboxylate transporter 2/3/5